MNRWLAGTGLRAAVAAVSVPASILAAVLLATAFTLPGATARTHGAWSALSKAALSKAAHSATRTLPTGPPAVVIVGIPGLRWPDVSPAAPRLWRLAADGSVGTLVVRTVL